MRALTIPDWLYDTRSWGVSAMNKLRLNLRLFFQGAYLSYIALFRWLSPANYIATKVVNPLNEILFFVFLGKFATNSSDPTFFVIGNAMHTTALSGIFGVTMSIGGDRWEGTLPYLFGTPANRMTMIVGRAFFHIFDGMLGVFLGFAWGVLLFSLNLSQADPLALIVTILVTTISTSGMGLLLGCFSLITRNTFFINNTMYFLLLLLSGANIPLGSLPPLMRSISDYLPLTRGIAAARSIIAGADLIQVLPALTNELLLGVIYTLLGYVMFRWFETQAKRRGTLEAI
ncbi:MAG: ABC transporter permease [Anaerolineales bacterium]|jgi:ABC-2 type transport system permease protein